MNATPDRAEQARPLRGCAHAKPEVLSYLVAMKRLLATISIVLALSCAACSRPAPVETRAFYYWRTTFALSAAERGALERQRATRLYVRLFDVTWDAAARRPVPQGTIVFRERPPADVEIVPVVYLANDVFAHRPDTAALAADAWRLVRGLAQGAPFTTRELQVDCDWTDQTRAAFFDFCGRLRATAARDGATLSATIRLHQVKYRERTGVPPVERGMLMFYNMGRLAPDAERPSIYDGASAALYARFIDRYPLPLDAALPVFSWAVHARGGHIVGLIEKPDPRALGALPALRATDARHLVAAEPAFFAGRYLQQGDTLALESVTPALAREAAATLAQYFHPRSAFALALFDLDERNLDDFAPQDLDALYAAVR